MELNSAVHVDLITLNVDSIKLINNNRIVIQIIKLPPTQLLKYVTRQSVAEKISVALAIHTISKHVRLCKSVNGGMQIIYNGRHR